MFGLGGISHPGSPVEEVMHALNDWVARGTILYLGISDTPAWIMRQANQCKCKPSSEQ